MPEELETTQGKEHALEQLSQRRVQNAGKKKINNAHLRAGSPMYYYCKSCDGEIILAESHYCAVPPLCKQCQALKDCGWLE